MIRNAFFAVLATATFACKNSANSSGESQQSEETTGMETNDATGSPAMNDSGMAGDSTTTGTTTGDNGAQSSAGSANQNGAGTNTGQQGGTSSTPQQ